MKTCQKTWMGSEKTQQPRWWLFNAQDKTLGRLSTEVASVLKGKHRPEFTPHVDMGDFVVVINCEKVRLTGQKAENKVYRRHTAYIGGLKESSFKEVLSKDPTFILENAVKGMMPKTRLGRQMLKKLKLYAGSDHPHQAQKLQAYNMEKIN